MGAAGREARRRGRGPEPGNVGAASGRGTLATTLATTEPSQLSISNPLAADKMPPGGLSSFVWTRKFDGIQENLGLEDLQNTQNPRAKLHHGLATLRPALQTLMWGLEATTRISTVTSFDQF